MSLIDRLNRAIVVLSAIALLVASCVLTYSVVLRYFSPQPTDWQDEFSVFLLIGVTFMSAGCFRKSSMLSRTRTAASTLLGMGRNTITRKIADLKIEGDEKN